MRLQNKVALITGGARGIGKTTAKRFMEEGASVVIADFDDQTGKETEAELRAIGPITFVKVNVTQTADAEAMVRAVLDAYGRIDILVNNAGITIDGFLTKMDEESWQKVIDVNLTGVFKCTKAVVPVMMEQGSGVILNASSVIGIYGNIGQTNYAATKAGVIGLTLSWAKEMGPKGIRVNAVAPGFVVTDMTSKVPQKVLDMMESKTPLKRLGQPEDIASAYLYLASDEASFVNGTVLSVDGGLVL
jgi:3-oxoacyl-[acyl-carrier protein] reductase